LQNSGNLAQVSGKRQRRRQTGMRNIDTIGVAPTLRAARPEDEPFQFAVFCARRAGPFERAGVPAPMLENLMSMQFRARKRGFGASHPDAQWFIVEYADEPVGELVLDAGVDTLHIVDITLAPHRQRHGLGPAILRAILHNMAPHAEARALIDLTNAPSRKMFAGLGFAERAYDDAHVEAFWRNR
jgi:GNAT superfamily N-acetyltransferase